MSKADNQDLSLGTLHRAVTSSVGNYTSEYKMSWSNGVSAATETSMSSFSISSCGSNIGGYAYLWEQTKEVVVTILQQRQF